MFQAAAVPAGRGARQRERTRRRLTLAARELIAARGVAGLRIADLTDTADVGRGSFYNHFASREELVDAVATEVVDELAAASVSELRPGDDPARAAARADRRFVRTAYTDPATARLCVHLAHAETAFVEAVRPYARQALDDGVATGRFVLTDAEMTLTVLTSSAVAVMSAVLAGRAAPNADAAHAEAMLVLFGVTGDEARRLAWEPLPPLPPAARERRSP